MTLEEVKRGGWKAGLSEVLTEPLPCAQDYSMFHEDSERHGACAQGAGGLFEGGGIVWPRK